MAAKKANPFAKQAAKAVPVKKAAGKVPAKKAAPGKVPPFAKKMSDSAGSMDGNKGTASGLGAAKKAAKKVAPKKMGELPNGKVGTPRQQRAATPGKRTQRVTGGSAMC